MVNKALVPGSPTAAPAIAGEGSRLNSWVLTGVVLVLIGLVCTIMGIASTGSVDHHRRSQSSFSWQTPPRPASVAEQVYDAIYPGALWLFGGMLFATGLLILHRESLLYRKPRTNRQ